MSVLKHRKIYEQHYGPIPKGYHVHHKDLNHRNNEPANLEALHPDDHAKKHGFLNNFIMAQARACDLAAAKNRGRKHTDEWKEAARVRMIGNTYLLGKKFSQEFVEKRRAKMMGKKIALGSKRTPNQLTQQSERMLGNTHALGNRFTMGLAPRFTCPQCQFTGGGLANMNRWHFDNCKKKVV